MRPMAVQNRLPEVPMDQLPRARTLKRMGRLRWIGREVDAEKILAMLDGTGRRSPAHPPQTTPIESFLSFTEHAPFQPAITCQMSCHACTANSAGPLRFATGMASHTNKVFDCFLHHAGTDKAK